MFVNIDYNKRPQEAKFHLAKPNMVVTSSISEKFGADMSLKLGSIHELNFSIPHKVEENHQMIKNKHVDDIKEKMLIRVTLGTLKEWFVVDEIEEDASDSTVFNIKAFSLGYELRGKRISDLELESTNLSELMAILLEGTGWTVGVIAPIFDATYRAFSSGSDSNVLESITNASETFSALVEWDTAKRKVSFKDPTENKTFKGMTVSYGRLLNSIKRTRTTDEMVTRLWVYGNEDLTIHTVNPTGMGYLEDFSYFMYPFKRDANKNVIQSSYFMSDALCHALLDQQAKVSQNANTIQSITESIQTKNVELISAQSLLDQYTQELKNIQKLLDVAKGAEDATAISLRTSEEQAKKQQISNQTTIVLQKEKELTGLDNQLKTIQDTINSGFTSALIAELQLYIIEATWRDGDYIDAQELYDDALKKFNELRQPKVVIDVSLDSLMNVIEEQYYWDKLNLGELIKVKYKELGIEYMAKVIEINYNLEEGTANVTVANTNDLLDDGARLLELLKQSSSASSVLQNNKYKWDKINALQKEVFEIVTNEWDATKNKITAGVNNTIEIGNRGIIIKNPDFPDEVVIMQSGVIALSKDGGETWKTAIKPDGIVAERLIGQIIAGQELLITNNAGTFTLDNNGAKFKVGSFIIESASGENAVDKWMDTTDFVNAYKDDNILTPFEKKMLKQEFDKIQLQYNANIDKINLYFPSGGSGLSYVSAYKSRYQELYDYLFVNPQGDKPILDPQNMAYSTRILATDFESKFKNYNAVAEELEKQILIKAKTYIEDARKEAQDNLDEVKNDIVYKTELHSSNGDVFKNGVIQTTFRAVVYRGKENITSTLPNSAFIWRKTDKDGVSDIAWKNAHVNLGSTIQITGADVHVKATFWCDIDIPE